MLRTDTARQKRQASKAGRPCAAVAILALLSPALAGCLTPDNPYALSPTELSAARAGHDVLVAGLEANDPDRKRRPRRITNPICYMATPKTHDSTAAFKVLLEGMSGEYATGGGGGGGGENPCN